LIARCVWKSTLDGFTWAAAAGTGQASGAGSKGTENKGKQTT
jgi:hypothetical protein